MRIAHTATAFAASVVLLVGCGAETGTSDANSEQRTSSASESSDAAASEAAWTGDVIPDGTYAKTNTRADARRLGLPRDMISEIPADGAHVELKIAGDVWVQYSEEDGVMVVGDDGTATYDTDGNWVAVSNSSGCPGCSATVDWTFEDQRLTLKVVDVPTTGDPVDVLIGRLVMDGEWTRR